MYRTIKNLVFPDTLDGILSDFSTLNDRLASLVEAKNVESSAYAAQITELQASIDANNVEAQRASRIIARVAEFVA